MIYGFRDLPVFALLAAVVGRRDESHRPSQANLIVTFILCGGKNLTASADRCALSARRFNGYFICLFFLYIFVFESLCVGRTYPLARCSPVQRSGVNCVDES